MSLRVSGSYANLATTTGTLPPTAAGNTKAPYVLAQSGVASSVTGTANETALATITVPGGVMGINGSLRITTTWSGTSSANNKTYRLRLGGIAGTAYQFNTAITTSSMAKAQAQIYNRGVTNSQVGSYSALTASYSASALPPITSNVDTTAPFDIVITGQLVTTTETITLDAYTVELLVP